jgi:hypothetical protein
MGFKRLLISQMKWICAFEDFDIPSFPPVIINIFKLFMFVFSQFGLIILVCNSSWEMFNHFDTQISEDCYTQGNLWYCALIHSYIFLAVLYFYSFHSNFMLLKGHLSWDGGIWFRKRMLNGNFYRLFLLI